MVCDKLIIEIWLYSLIFTTLGNGIIINNAKRFLENAYGTLYRCIAAKVYDTTKVQVVWVIPIH